MNWQMFKDGDTETLDSWNQSATACLRKVSPDMNNVELILPAAEMAKFALTRNIDLMGQIRVLFRDGEERKFDIPMPYHGVFVAHGGDAENKDAPQRLVWSSWFGEMPGLRKVRVANGEEVLRMGLPDGQFILVDEKKLSKFDLNEIAFVRWWAKEFPGVYDKGLLHVLAKYEKGFGGEKTRRAEFCNDVRDWAEKLEGKLKILDADDLDHRMAVTFPIWLRNRLLRLYYRFFVLQDGTRDSWEELARALVPVPSIGRQRYTGFDVIRPDNILEAAGRICGIKRFKVSRRYVGFLPAAFRQNHPSFEGRICPIESPESEMVGIQLQLARGAWVDENGQINAKSGRLGEAAIPSRLPVRWCTSLIPFLYHNDDARSMMGA